MEDSTPSSNADIVDGLLTVIPRVLRRLRADLPSVETLKAMPGGSDILELRSATGQMALLRHLSDRERCTMQEVANQLVITPSTATGIVKKLLAHDYIERLRHEEDWRVVTIKLTERGRQAVTLYDHIRYNSLQKRLTYLSEEEQQQIRDALPALKHLIAIELVN